MTGDGWVTNGAATDKLSRQHPAALRQLMRLLRVVEAAGGTVPLAEAGTDRVTLGHRGRKLGFAASLVAACERSGLVMRRAQDIVLQPAGTAMLRRLQHPEAAYHAQHAPLQTRRIDMPDGPNDVVVNQGESPLARLTALKARSGKPYLSQAQFAAGERLRGDFERGRLRPAMSVAWDKPVTGGSGAAAELSDFALDARRRVERALARLEPGLAGVAVDICCFLKGLEQVERERQWPPRSAKLMLRTALSVLADHYGLEARVGDADRPLLHWGDESYRPSL